MPSAPRMVAAIGTAGPGKTRAAVPQAARAAGSIPARTSTPRSSRSSRRSSRGRSSEIAVCRSRIASGLAGASSHAASVSSPARVRAVQRRSKSDPRPKRSRSAA